MEQTAEACKIQADHYGLVSDFADGPVEFIFILESNEDPAYKELHNIVELAGKSNVSIITAGLSTTCSQKLHK